MRQENQKEHCYKTGYKKLPHPDREHIIDIRSGSM